MKVGAQVLAEPSDEALEQALRHEGLVPQGMRQVWPGVIKPVAPHMLRHSFAPTKSNHMTLVHVNCRGLNPTGLSEGSTVPILCGLI